ncbi:MAG: hypothetical protein Q8W46_09120 [Candidatus Palauibacterales bacterium]|jgi:hypothetical protein|nr:hypothetical protein [Candidatus Palauibacterales bacterium]
MPQTFELVLTGFDFPRKLPRRKANFRFVADVRYVNGRGEHDTEHSVLPDLDRFWECDPERSSAPEFVRGPEKGKSASLDMSRVDDWDRLVLLVRGDSVHSVQFKVLDVNRSDGWDRMRRALGDVVAALIGRARASIPEKAWVASDSLGTAASDLESSLVARLAGGDQPLFRGSTALSAPGEYEVSGEGTEGRYSIRCRLDVRPD